MPQGLKQAAKASASTTVLTKVLIGRGSTSPIMWFWPDSVLQRLQTEDFNHLPSRWLTSIVLRSLAHSCPHHRDCFIKTSKREPAREVSVCGTYQEPTSHHLCHSLWVRTLTPLPCQPNRAFNLFSSKDNFQSNNKKFICPQVSGAPHISMSIVPVKLLSPWSCPQYLLPGPMHHLLSGLWAPSTTPPTLASSHHSRQGALVSP